MLFDANQQLLQVELLLTNLSSPMKSNGGEHVIFYKIDNGVLDIIGLPHHSQDVVSHLRGDID
jgi:hypothetical protein